MSIKLPSVGDPLENLLRLLKSKQALLVFDNCEHLVEPAARIIASILSGCPQIKVLASSRQGLDIAGERTYRLPSLEVPAEDAAEGIRADDAIRFAAVALSSNERARLKSDSR